MQAERICSVDHGKRAPVECPVCGKRYDNPGPLAICIGRVDVAHPSGTHDSTVMVEVRCSS